MGFYLITAVPVRKRLGELEDLLGRDAFLEMRPFGRALTRGLRDARVRKDGMAVWEEEDYCVPPLAQERAAVLDLFFEALEAEPVAPGEGWERIAALPRLFPGLAEGAPRTGS